MGNDMKLGEILALMFEIDKTLNSVGGPVL
jgi:hypothetical protein